MEVLTVVAMLSALAAIAIPSVMPSVYRARRTEAYGVLKSIYAAQKMHHFEHGRYADTFDQIGVAVVGGTQIDPQTIQARYYTYTVLQVDGGRNFMAMATGDIAPGNAMNDILVIRNNIIVKE